MSLTQSPHLQAARKHAEERGNFEKYRNQRVAKNKNRGKFTKFERGIPLPESTPIYAMSTGDMSRTPEKQDGYVKWNFTVMSMGDIEDAKKDETGRRYIEIERKLSKNARTEYERQEKDIELDRKATFDNVVTVRIYEFSDIALRVKVATKFAPVNSIVKLSNVYISHWFKNGKFLDLWNAGKVETASTISSDGLLFEFLANSPSICDKKISPEYLDAEFIKSCEAHRETLAAAVADGANPDDVYKTVPDFRLKYGKKTYFMSTFNRDLETQAAKASLSEGVLVDRIFTDSKNGQFTPEVYNKALQKKENVAGFDTNIIGDQWSGGSLGEDGTSHSRFKIYATALSSAVALFRIPDLDTWNEFGPILLNGNFLVTCRENMRETSGLQTADDAYDEASEFDIRSKMKIESIVCNLPFNLAKSGIPVDKEYAAAASGFLESPSTDDAPAKFAMMLKNPLHHLCRHSEKDTHAADVICLNFYEGPTEAILRDYHFFAITNQEYTRLHRRIMDNTTPNKLAILANKDAVKEYFEIQSDGESGPTYEDDMTAFEKKYNVNRDTDAKILQILQSVKDADEFSVLIYAVKKPVLLYADANVDTLSEDARRFGFEYDVTAAGDFVGALAKFISGHAYRESEEVNTDILKRPRSPANEDAGEPILEVAEQDDDDDDDDEVSLPSPAKKRRGGRRE